MSGCHVPTKSYSCFVSLGELCSGKLVSAVPVVLLCSMVALGLSKVSFIKAHQSMVVSASIILAKIKAIFRGNAVFVFMCIFGKIK